MSLLSPQLEAFMMVAKHKSVHAAANEICLTQTAVTQRIRALEQKLSTTLFVRSRRGMILTPEGASLLRYCHAAKELEGEALASICGLGQTSTISIEITGPTSIMHARVIPQCMNVMRQFSNLLLHFNVRDQENIDQFLRSGQSQFAIIPPENVAREMESQFLEPEQYVLVGAKGWATRELQDIVQNEHIIDYNPSDQMTFNYLKHYNLFANAQHDRHFVNRPEAISSLVCEGFGYSVLTKEFAKPHVDAGDIHILNDGKIYEKQLALAWYPRHEAPAYFAELIKAIR